jgi:hypothetical protein
MILLLPEELSSEIKVHRRRSDTLDARIIAKLQAIIDQDPGRFMKSLARELDISEFAVRKKMMQDINYKAYALRRGQFLSQTTKERRLEKAKLLLKKLKNPAPNNQLIFFSDEKNFSQDQKVIRKNNRWLRADISEVPVVMAIMFPATVMVLDVVSNEADLMPPHIFAKGLKINTLYGVAAGCHYVFQHDWAPAHNSKASPYWCRENLPKFWQKEN